MTFKKFIIGGLIGLTVISQNTAFAFADTISYQAKSGDTYWKISNKYSINLNDLLIENSAKSNSYLSIGQTIQLPYNPNEKLLYKIKWGDTYWKISERYNIDINTLLEANNAKAQTTLNINDVIIIPGTSSHRTHMVQSGETYWKISQKYSIDINELLSLNNANKYSQLYVGQKILIPGDALEDEKAYVTYSNYTVQRGDNLWNISIKFGIPQYELMRVNNMNENTMLNIGDILKIPVHHVPVKDTLGAKYGEFLDWWTQAQYVVPINKVFTVRDYYTGKQWTMKRTIGANHADCEPLTESDSAIMKEVWGGSFSWRCRPVLVIVDGRKIAASASSMPHDIQYIKNNGVTGHMDIHFANSTRHADGKIDYSHQDNIKISAGIK